MTVDQCKRVGVVFHDAKTKCEVVNSSRLEVQCLEKVGTVSVEKVDSCQVYVPRALKDSVSVVTSAATSVNVVLVHEDGNASESPIPEQFNSYFQGDKLVTEPVVHASAG